MKATLDFGQLIQFFLGSPVGWVLAAGIGLVVLRTVPSLRPIAISIRMMLDGALDFAKTAIDAILPSA